MSDSTSASPDATVATVMNHEVYSVSPDEAAGEVLGMILTLGITAAPVVDTKGLPLGLVSLRNLARAQRSDAVSKHMTTPAATISPTAPVSEAAQLMGQLSYHHLVVVDEAEHVVGFVSSLDVIRGLVGLPASHPPAFPHQEPESGLSWTPTVALEADNIERLAPAGPGMLVLTSAESPDEVLWAEASNDVRGRLQTFVSGDHNLPDRVSEHLDGGKLGFRTASFGGGGGGSEAGSSSMLDVLLTR